MRHTFDFPNFSRSVCLQTERPVVLELPFARLQFKYKAEFFLPWQTSAKLGELASVIGPTAKSVAHSGLGVLSDLEDHKTFRDLTKQYLALPSQLENEIVGFAICSDFGVKGIHAGSKLPHLQGRLLEELYSRICGLSTKERQKTMKKIIQQFTRSLNNLQM